MGACPTGIPPLDEDLAAFGDIHVVSKSQRLRHAARSVARFLPIGGRLVTSPSQRLRITATRLNQEIRPHNLRAFLKSFGVPMTSYRASLMLKHLGQCFYCRACICYAQATTDHFIPRRHGGKNCADNRVLACQDCNNAKADINPVDFGVWHPDDLSPEGQRGLSLLRRLVIKRQLSKHRQRRKIAQQFPGLPARADLARPVPFHAQPEGTAAMPNEKPKPVFDACSIERSEGRDDAFFRQIGAAWPANAPASGHRTRPRRVGAAGRLSR